jgi:hypothetical protein
MGTSGFGWQRPKLKLLDGELTLDPKIEAQIRALQWEIDNGGVHKRLLQPNFAQFTQSHLDWVLRQPLPKPKPPLVPAGKGPATPKPAEFADLGKAIWAVPAFKLAVTRLGDNLTNDFRRGWRQSGAGEKTAIITTGVLIAGGALAGALINPDSRLQLLTFADGKSIPVPGVDGLSFKLARRGSSISGGSVTLPLGVAGLGATGNFQAGEGARWLRNSQYDVMVTLDVMKLARSLKK